MPIPATFAPLQYQDSGEIVLPVSFNSVDLLGLDKSAFSVERMAGSDAERMDYYVRNAIVNDVIQDDAYEVVFIPAADTRGLIKVDITGDVTQISDLAQDTVTITPLLISYNRLPVAIKNIETPYKTTDDWWNIFIEFEYPVIGFGIHSMWTGIEHTDSFIYRGTWLDVRPSEPPPAFSAAYPKIETFHCVGDWHTIDLQNDVQATYFWLKLQSSDDDTVPEVALREVHRVTPVSVAP